MWKKMLCLAMCLGLLLSLSLPALADDEEEVSITIFGPEETTAPEELAPEPTPDPAQPVYEADGSVLLTMSFTGDVTIGSDPRQGSSIFEKELKKQKGDITFPFRNVKDIFQADDLTMVNFEGTLTTAGVNSRKADYSFLFRADPSYVEMLPNAGIETVSFENNHADDMGEEGLAETKRTLLSAGVTYASEDEPCVMTVKGVKIGSLAYQGWKDRRDTVLEKLPKDIQSLRDEGCQVIIVSFHWGNEKDYSPTETQITLGRAAVDAGADLVIGHHSHRINPIEYYNGVYICYSLGNFSFAGNKKPDDMSTFIFQIRMRVKEGQASSEAFRIIPCRISSRTDYNDFAPTPYTKDTNIEAVVKTLQQNGKKLEYAVGKYPLEFPY